MTERRVLPVIRVDEAAELAQVRRELEESRAARMLADARGELEASRRRLHAEPDTYAEHGGRHGKAKRRAKAKAARKARAKARR